MKKNTINIIICLLLFNLQGCTHLSVVSSVLSIVDNLISILKFSSDNSKLSHVDPTPTPYPDPTRDFSSISYSPTPDFSSVSYSPDPTFTVDATSICPENIAEDNYKEASEYISKGNYTDSLYLLNKVIEDCPDKWGKPYVERGFIYMKTKEFYLAHSDFERAVAFSNDLEVKAIAHYNNACTYSLENKVDEALVELESAFYNNAALKIDARNDSDLTNVKYTDKFSILVN